MENFLWKVDNSIGNQPRIRGPGTRCARCPYGTSASSISTLVWVSGEGEESGVLGRVSPPKVLKAGCMIN